jgi:hypothetical protein
MAAWTACCSITWLYLVVVGPDLVEYSGVYTIVESHSSEWICDILIAHVRCICDRSIVHVRVTIWDSSQRWIVTVSICDNSIAHVMVDVR